MKTRWGPQKVLDEVMASYLFLDNYLDAAKSGTGPQKGKAFRSGVGPLAVKQDAAIITVDAFIHIDTPTEEQEDREHASGLLEPWLAAAKKLSQQTGNVVYRQPMDLRGFGRTWSNVYPHPDLWSDADSEYHRLVEAYDNAEGEEALKEAKAELSAYKRDNWPIRWTYVDPRGTWTYFGGQRWLPEVTETLKMSADDIADEYGEEFVPGQTKSGAAEIEVIRYANYKWCADVIDKKVAYQWEHGLKRPAYILGESELLPSNDKGLRWAGGLYYAQNMQDVFDEILTDLRTNHRNNTVAQMGVWLDKDSYEESAKVGGRPPPMTLQPGGPPLMFWTGEDVRPIQLPPMNPQSVDLLRFTYNLIQQSMIRPIERGEAKSGTSQNQFSTAVQISERSFGPSMKAMTGMMDDFAKLAFACVERLDEPVPVYTLHGKGVIEVAPKDVKGWYNAVHSVSDNAIPIDRNSQVATAQAEQNVGVSVETSLERLGFENPGAEMRKKDRENLRNATMEAMIEAAKQRSAEMLTVSPPGTMEAIIESLVSATPALQELLKTLLGQGAPPPAPPTPPMPTPPMGPAIPGTVNQSMANERRAGVPQMPRMPGEAVTGG